MATKQKLLLVEQATVDPSIVVPGNMPVAILYDSQIMDWLANTQAPDNLTLLSSLQLIVCRQAIANIYIKVMGQLIRAGSTIATATTGFLEVAVSADDDIYEALPIDASALASLSGVQNGDILSFTV